jgi:hypothetical protein
MADGSWKLGAGSWEMADGSWQMGVGRWELADGRWRLESGKAESGKRKVLTTNYTKYTKNRDVMQNVLNRQDAKRAKTEPDVISRRWTQTDADKN